MVMAQQPAEPGHLAERVDAGKSCVALASKDTHIAPQITADDQTVSLEIFYGGNGTSGVLLLQNTNRELYLHDGDATGNGS
jgi:hypothetical protein